ncbi:hypothetical protein [Pseudomonas juntendi]|uniref:hypothetical protein n=1 Tax=Pseudomonas juntendi TaxID=2666183 RepID=UPI000ECED095|nr:hypothetical protein [Pseudomonas juntendi]HCV37540.1 hypothetical protein [Pseudomonas sp.]
MTKDDGGAAFPRPFSKTGEYSDSTKEHAQAGMTLLDYFAAKAMQGMSANPYYDDFDFDVIAETAYGQAAAMLAARVKP